MPSLRMKRSSLFCVNENKCLLVSHISSTISEKSHLKISHIAAEEGTICQDCHEVSPSTESNIQDWESTGANELLSVEDIHIKQLPRSSNDSEVIKEVELPQVTCSANFGTIFLPTLRYIDGYDVPHSWNNSDFYTSDMVLAGSPYDGNFICNDLAKALIFPERDTAESSIFFDVTEGHMSLPFLDYIVESSEMVDVRPSDKARMDYDNSNLSFAIRQICPGDQEADLRRCVESDEAQYFDAHSFIRNLPDLSDVVPNGRPTILPKESREEKPITLVLDLDETLVHSTLERCDDADFTFTVFFNMKEHSVYVKERPHLRTFLKKVEEMFQIVVFTASQSIYAEQLLDILDPDGKLISGRAYRESCIFSDGNYTKDLTVLGLDLAKVMIIDNSPQVFRLQVNNGIPIKSWFDDPSDNELISLIPFLETLANADDVRPLIAKRFGNKE